MRITVEAKICSYQEKTFEVPERYLFYFEKDEENYTNEEWDILEEEFGDWVSSFFEKKESNSFVEDYEILDIIKNIQEEKQIALLGAELKRLRVRCRPQRTILRLIAPEKKIFRTYEAIMKKSNPETFLDG